MKLLFELSIYFVPFHRFEQNVLSVRKNLKNDLLLYDFLGKLSVKHRYLNQTLAAAKTDNIKYIISE